MPTRPSLLDVCAMRARDEPRHASKEQTCPCCPIRCTVLLPVLTSPMEWDHGCGRTVARHKRPARNLMLMPGRWIRTGVSARGAAGAGQEGAAQGGDHTHS